MGMKALVWAVSEDWVRKSCGATREYTTAYFKNGPRSGGSAAGSMKHCSLAIPAEKDRELSVGHFLGHVQNKLAIFLVGLAQ